MKMILFGILGKNVMKTLHQIRTLQLLMVKNGKKYYSDLFSDINKRNQTTPQKTVQKKISEDNSTFL